MSIPQHSFLRTELTALGLPPDSPQDVEHRDEIHCDEQVGELKYSQLRRLVFTHPNGKTFAVEYEAPVSTGDYEVDGGPVENHGWQRTVKAVEVVKRCVPVVRWMPAAYAGAAPDTGNPVHQDLADRLYTEAGCREDVARAAAADFLARHTRELAAFLFDLHPDAAECLRGHAAPADVDETGGNLP